MAWMDAGDAAFGGRRQHSWRISRGSGVDGDPGWIAPHERCASLE
jgi:hypothetical protein